MSRIALRDMKNDNDTRGKALLRLEDEKEEGGHRMLFGGGERASNTSDLGKAEMEARLAAMMDDDFGGDLPDAWEDVADAKPPASNGPPGLPPQGKPQGPSPPAVAPQPNGTKAGGGGEEGWAPVGGKKNKKNHGDWETEEEKRRTFIEARSPLPFCSCVHARSPLLSPAASLPPSGSSGPAETHESRMTGGTIGGAAEADGLLGGGPGLPGGGPGLPGGGPGLPGGGPGLPGGGPGLPGGGRSGLPSL